MRRVDLEDFMGKLIEGGLTAKMAQEVRKHPYLAGAMVSVLNSELKNAAFTDEIFSVTVDYKVQSFKQLKKVFDWVPNLFDGRLWGPHSSIVGTTLLPGEKFMCLRDYGKSMSSEDVIASAAKGRWRVATHKEAIAFAKAHPELQRKSWIVALGSSAMGGGCRLVAVLCGGCDGRGLGGLSFDRGWDAGTRFLLVRK